MAIRLRPVWSILLIAALLLAACGGAAPTAAPEGGQPAAETGADDAQPAIVRIGWGGSPDTLNPGAATLEEAYTLFELVYSSMYELNLDGSYSPDLATSVEVSEDGTVYTFKIRDDLRWHDGLPVTARDVVFSYRFYQKHDDFPFMPAYTGYFDTIEAPDDQTVVLTLTEAIPNIESQLFWLFILPEHIWAEHDTPEGAATFENTAIIGSGPFKMREYRQGEFVHLEAVKDHPVAPPKVDELVFQTFDNQDALVQALLTGQVDMITEMPNTAVPTLRNADNVELVIGAPLNPNVADIILNQVPPELCPPDGVCSGHPALRDLAVRQALAHATDKQKIIDVVLLGLGTPGLTLIPDGLGAWYNDTIKDHAFDIAEANRLLDEAGYLDGDGDNVREMPDGSRPLSFRLNWPSDSATAPRVAELLGETWRQIGVELQPQTLDPDTLTSICCPTFDSDIIIWGWGSDPDPAFLLSVHLTEEIPTGNSETGYSNPEFDELYGQQATALDPAERQAIIWRMQEILHRDVAYIVPYYDQAVQAYRTDRFQGWVIDQPKVALQRLSSLAVIEPVGD
jgi:peptide/nickel transport system substrate-binding protein